MEWVHLLYTEKHPVFQQHMFTWPLLIVSTFNVFRVICVSRWKKIEEVTNDRKKLFVQL